MQKVTGNHCINFPKHQAMKNSHKNRKQDDGIRNPKSGRERQSMASQVVSQGNPCQNYKTTKNKTLEIKSKAKIGTWNVRTLLRPLKNLNNK